MFPAPAGMNRCCKRDYADRKYVPRTRGDEPFALFRLHRLL